ncbi:SDR family NAD(P)-dependent oxidoreductase [Metallibacterium sp.]|uniref:SDR family NAD(P)-dependent oxidoreductase n=1 Tax=Metallibacterium sp. TaxID=2940281 RepID=UPI00260706D2|nr:SDR family NAD(P)-dependent oxidoreductase [Metallibacterium sp.]
MAAPAQLWIAGYGPGLGAALAARFAREHWRVLALSRSAPEPALASGAHVALDLLAADVAARLAQLIAEHGAPRVLVYNVGVFRRAAFAALREDDFRACWEGMALGAFRVAQAVLPAMTQAGGGTLIFSGATASLRGGAEFAAFASAKFALRGLAQSLARAWQPRGVHVAHAILDGVIAGSARGGQHAARLDPDAIASCYWQLAQQPPGAWTHELDLRGADEPF